MADNRTEKKRAAEQQLAEIAKITDEALFQRLDTDAEGLNQVEAADRLEEYGRNIIDTGNDNSLLKRIWGAIINPFNIVLLIVAGVTLVTDVILPEKPSWATFLMLIFVVAVSAIISFVQEEKSNSAAQKLQNMITNKIDVIRNGSSMEISIEEVVPGDVVKLASGDMLPGDVRFIETKDLFTDQSQLTGESQPVEKFAGPDPEGSEITELDNIGFMGSNIVSGSAKAVILTTGNQTYLGSMAKSLNTYQEKSSFDRNIDSISSLLIKFMVVMVPVIFIANFITKGNWLDSLMFGITIAVGLMPEMLPVIMTSSLAKGAVNMSKKQTIVKRLGAIQTFGEMDILCTDKTGTLTQDEIVLEKDLNVLDEGVIEGRRTFANMTKYLKMSVSGNFGNMFSVLIASIFLPFLPLLPIHILVQNILNDFAQLGMPFDHVEAESIRLPKKWNIAGIKKFMVIFGLLSTVLDVLCFLVLWFVYRFNNDSMAGFFQNGWFMFGVISQTVVIHTIRTPKIPFIQDRASKQLTLSTLAVVIVTLLIGFTAIANIFDLPVMVPSFGLWLAGLMIVYTVFAQIMKRIYMKSNQEWV